MRYLAADLGGTRIKFGLVGGGKVEAFATIPAPTRGAGGKSDTDVLRILAEAFRGLPLGQGRLEGISLGLPAFVDPGTGRVRDEFGKYAELVRVDLEDWAREEFGLPLAAENDARLAAIGEWQQGAGRDQPEERSVDDLVMITLGTGIGSGVITGGRPLLGAHGQAGSLGGHLSVQLPPDSTSPRADDACACGNSGCAELLASDGVIDRLARAHPAFPGSALARLGQEGRIDYRVLFSLPDDACARDLVERSLRVWETVAVNLVQAHDPELLVLGGGIMGSADRILPALRKAVETRAHEARGRVRVVAATLGDAAALQGGSWILRAKTGATP